MAHIEEREGKKGTAYRVQICSDGKRVSKTFKTEQAAKVWASTLEGEAPTQVDQLRLVAPTVGTLLTEDEVVLLSVPFIKLVGIYFLIHNSKVVYVGKSTHLMRRLTQHWDNAIEFDSYHFVLCSKSNLDLLEQFYIKRFNPVFNSTFKQFN